MNLPPPKMVSNAVKAITTREERALTVEEVQDFMRRHGFNDKTFAEFLGVTLQAVRLWVRGQRDMSLTNSRLLRMFDKYPHLMREF